MNKINKKFINLGKNEVTYKTKNEDKHIEQKKNLYFLYICLYKKYNLKATI